MITRKDFGEILLSKLSHNLDVVVLSRWAHQFYLENNRELEEGLKDILIGLWTMEDGPEFEYTHSELSALANTLIDDKGENGREVKHD